MKRCGCTSRSMLRTSPFFRRTALARSTIINDISIYVRLLRLTLLGRLLLVGGRSGGFLLLAKSVLNGGASLLPLLDRRRLVSRRVAESYSKRTYECLELRASMIPRIICYSRRLGYCSGMSSDRTGKASRFSGKDGPIQALRTS